jgi:uncharacterized protein YunC (DUF1805 family)
VVSLIPIRVGSVMATAVTVQLPKTHLVAIATDKGYIMCGALDVDVLNTRLKDRQVIAGRAFGVKSIDDLLEAPLVDVTDDAKALGIMPGMKGREALERMV